ncbi:conserved hypothetical protein [Beutenbergia cavernae DSM 12333]|uniref:DUF3097 domain-containing protein n=1 Tax=Beutenbergia cavernae (strain ATCC BAA-8 / DSM 12333 / CCUG 43141 / JCM 11478 / NBRC 16432 / NCIMB 13614 / HKI 0122) TaxID=471853 RepID=C5C490_BEUC1|nr:conserved hypothetical protein [Beutenbergia cavernae DSM 12333]
MRTGTRRVTRDEPAVAGLVVEDVETGWVGAVVRVEKSAGGVTVALEDRRGTTRTFPLGPGFWVDGEPVRLVMPRGERPRAAVRTASGSRAVAGARARVARASRLWVEGRHDAELVEHVWGEDLRIEGVVVELLDGVDNLADALTEFAPGPGRRAGVLVDHLVPGSKEQRLTAEALRRLGPAADAVLVLGHPYVDVWQAVRPERVGLRVWPDVPRSEDIKTGTLRALGWPHADQADVAAGWKRILRNVRDYRDLDPALLGRVEELVDFVTGEG